MTKRKPVDINREQRKPWKYVRIPEDLHAQLKPLAAADSRTLTQYVILLLKRAIGGEL